MKYDHEKEKTLQAVGLEIEDMVALIKEIAETMGQGEMDKLSKGIQAISDKTETMTGDEKDKRIRLMHYLAFCQCEYLATSFVKHQLTELIKMGGLNGSEQKGQNNIH